jgi:alkylhydroperoxidase/carboxymuconolactone decarboxylase family protein YurZ
VPEAVVAAIASGHAADAECKSAWYVTGEEVMRAIGGTPDTLDKWEQLDPGVGEALRHLLAESCFGRVWSRPALDLRTRRVMTLTTIATLGRERLLRNHIAGALGQGFTRAEVLEVFLHLVPYAGFPTAISAIECAGELFAEIDARTTTTQAPRSGATSENEESA